MFINLPKIQYILRFYLKKLMLLIFTCQTASSLALQPRSMNLLLLSRFSHVRLCVTPQTAAHQAPRPWDFPGKNTEAGCHFLLQCRKVESESEVVSHDGLLVTPWTAAHHAPPSMGLSRQEYWSGVPLPSSLYKVQLEALF